MDDKDTRATMYNNMNNNKYNNCVMGAETGPQTIIVRQVIGEKERQKVMDIHVVVPAQKPSIEQIVDVFVKNVEVNSVDVITDKVVVRGEFEIKAIYVACLPDQPVHAVEIKHIKWTQDIDIPGARRGMDSEASVVVEFVDYEIADENCRAYKHKYHGCVEPAMEYDNNDDYCPNNNHNNCNNNDDDDDCDDHHHHHHDECTREFDVSVVLKITGKVMADREVTIGTGTVPTTPKG